MRTGWLIYDKEQYRKNTWFADRLIECGKPGLQLKLIILEKLRYGINEGKNVFRYDGGPLDIPEFAVVRTISPMLSAFLRASGIRVINPPEIAGICNDKRYTCMLMQGTVPMMRTRFCETASFDITTVDRDEYPVVIKSSDGHGGTGVFLAYDPEELKESLCRLKAPSFLIQELCRPYGQDLRAYVLGGNILAAVLRTSKDRGFRSNYSLGGAAEAYSLSKAEEGMIQRVIGALPVKPDFVGIDFLVTDKGLVFNEIEDVAGCRMLYACTAKDAAAELMDYIQNSLFS
jgi:RimK family alpha-L-glutamate ligase